MSVYIEKLSFIAGHKIDSDPLEFSPGSITILVGPNNSGKSQSLREIEDLCKGSKALTRLVRSVEVTHLQNQNDIETLLNPYEQKSTLKGDPLPPDNRLFSKPSLVKEIPNQIQINSTEINEWLENHEKFKDRVVQFCIIRLDGESRFELVKPKKITSLQNLPVNHLDILFRDDEKREKLRRTTEDAFGLYFVVDRTGDNLCIRMSRKPPPSNEVERGGDNNSIEFHKNADLIIDLGDGVQTFVGLIAGLSCLSHTIILIDEPEAFLAPSVAKRLGREIINITQERKASLIVATHSADFVMGCIETSNEPKIIRLTYENQKATAREIKTDVIREFNTNPCLRSASAIRGLFHKGIVVTEGHRDRVFYDDINHRLISHDTGKGTDDVLFIDSGGGINMIYRTIEPLRKMGVPAVAIVDLDVITKNNNAWDNLMKACQISVVDSPNLNSLRENVLQHFEEIKGKNIPCPIKSGGIKRLSNQHTIENVEKLINDLASYGLFVVSVGALENWIPSNQTQEEWKPKLAKGSEWEEGWLDEMGQPEENDFNVWWGLNKWSFINEVAEWIKDPNRKGME